MPEREGQQIPEPKRAGRKRRIERYGLRRQFHRDRPVDRPPRSRCCVEHHIAAVSAANERDRISRLAVPCDQRPGVLGPPLAPQQRSAHAQACRAGDLDGTIKPGLGKDGAGRDGERHLDRFHDDPAGVEQGIRRVGRHLGVGGALHDDVGKAFKGFRGLRCDQFAAKHETPCLALDVARQIFPDAAGHAEMELIDGAPQLVGVRHRLTAERAAARLTRLDPHA